MFTVDWLPPAVAIDNELASVNIKMEVQDNPTTAGQVIVNNENKLTYYINNPTL